ncbi:MAG: radical SAM protein, partial [Lachnospiraceae bacterium]|nr:radical SAM protein [Lachnospiraceae bacterium]
EETAIKYSAAEGYFNRVSEAVSEMIRQTGKPELDCNGIIKKGVIIRHLVLPGHRKESMDILRWMKECLTDNSYMLSLMSQYTPSYKSDAYSEINRRVTTFEYDSVLDFAISLGIINGYMQDRKSAVKEYTPPFDLEGIERKESNGD